jgi:hypothetical protein
MTGVNQHLVEVHPRTILVLKEYNGYPTTISIFSLIVIKVQGDETAIQFLENIVPRILAFRSVHFRRINVSKPNCDVPDPVIVALDLDIDRIAIHNMGIAIGFSGRC